MRKVSIAFIFEIFHNGFLSKYYRLSRREKMTKFLALLNPYNPIWLDIILGFLLILCIAGTIFGIWLSYQIYKLPPKNPRNKKIYPH
jgi:hypothetical protein